MTPTQRDTTKTYQRDPCTQYTKHFLIIGHINQCIGPALFYKNPLKIPILIPKYAATGIKYSNAIFCRVNNSIFSKIVKLIF